MSVDLGTRYLGFQLRCPIVASASPLTGEIATLRQLEDAGAGAVVLPSLFEEQIEHDELELHTLHDRLSAAHPEADSYLPDLTAYNTGPEHYLELVATARAALAIPVIASLNGSSSGGWVRYARLIEEAGAAALELNIYLVAADADISGAAIEDRYVELVAAVRAATRLKLAVKVGPYFSSLPHMARRLVAAGADGLVLFNRFLEPDLDLERMEVTPSLVLSTAAEARLPLRWIAILRGQVEGSLAATSGVHGPAEALKLLLAGADVACMTSALLNHGPERLEVVLTGVRRWLEEHEYASVEQMKGSMSRENSPNPEAFERTNYMRALRSWGSR